MTDADKRELARKITVLYDSMILIWTQLERDGKLTKGELDLLWATWSAWGAVLGQLGITGNEKVNALRNHPVDELSTVDKVWKAYQ